MNTEFLVLAQGSSIDGATNQISIFNIIDEIEIGLKKKGDPFNVPLLVQVVSSIKRDDTDPAGAFQATIKARTKNPDGSTKEDTVPIKFENHHVRIRLRIGLTVFITSEGIYTIEIFSDKGTLMSSKELKVTVKDDSILPGS